MTDYGARLFEQHAELLRASAVPPDLARERGYVTVDVKARLTDLGFSPAQARVPGLLIPLHSSDGKCSGFQFRPDSPRERSGKPLKYETPPGQANRLDVPPGVGPKLGDPAVDLWVTEGARKADAAAAVGLACVSLSGVWNWRTTNPEGGKVALPDWQDVALNGRRVVIAYDSDMATKRSVLNAMTALAGYLASKGAKVHACKLPDTGSGEKCGLDDYLAAGHSRTDLEQLVYELTEKPKETRESAATELMHLAHDHYRIGVSADDEPFAVPRTGPRIVRPLRGGKGSLRAALADAYYTYGGRCAPQQALTEALITLEGQAQREEAERLHLRVAEHNGTHYVDLGDATGRAVALTSTGWQLGRVSQGGRCQRLMLRG